MALVVPNQQQPPLVDVLVLNWNGRRTLPRCLDALHRETYPTFQVTVIDNASTDGSPDLVRSFYSWATLLRLPENMGFGQAYNRAVGRSKADLIALLNNDAYPEPGWLAALVQAIQADHQAAACTSRIRLTHEGRETRDQRPETRDQRRGMRNKGTRDEGRGTRLPSPPSSTTPAAH